MKRKEINIILAFLIMISLLLSSCAPNEQTAAAPFDVTCDGASFTYEIEKIPSGDSLIDSEEPILRLHIRFSARNVTNHDYSNVWYECSLNEEAEPFIASRIIRNQITDKNSITTKEKAQSSNDELLLAWGFDHHWAPSLTKASELKEYYNLKLTDIQQHLKSITITIHWDGGMQTEEFPLSLQKTDIDLLLSIQNESDPPA